MNQISHKSQIKKQKKTICFHCGEPCKDDQIRLAEKAFCCEGCKMVYSILEDNDLCNYYDLNTMAGVSQKDYSNKEYSFLEDQSVADRLIDFTDGEKTKVHFYLPQIHCSSCLWLLENLSRLHEGILNSRVDFLKKEVSITFSASNMNLREVVELLARVGYPPEINLNDLEHQEKVIDKSLYYKLGLAGFAFGNIMLLSFPEYLGMNAKANTTLVYFFGYLNILLGLPVIFYSGWEYFRSAWQGLKQRHLNIDVPISLGITALFSRSVFEILTHTGAGYLDSMAGLVFFLLIGKWFQKRTYDKLSFDRDYKSYFPIACNKKVEGKEVSVSLDNIKKGDMLIIRHGELIPADAYLLDGESKIDYSFVTGESDLIKKQKGALLYAGGRQMGAAIEISVAKKVSNSYLTQLWNEDTFTKSNKVGEVSDLADKVARFFTWVILTVAFATLIYWLPKDMGTAINAFTAVLIIACPCAVALSIPFTFGNVLRIFSRQGIYLKNIHVIESLSKINHIVFDKTGTITKVNSGSVHYRGKPLEEYIEQLLFSLVYHSSHPLSKRIKEGIHDQLPLSVLDFEEVKGKGVRGRVEDHYVRIGSNDFINGLSKKDTLKQNVYVEVDGEVYGAYTFDGAYRQGLNQVLNRLKKWAGLSLISGDNDREKGILLPLFETERNLYFNKKPADKLNYIKLLQSDNQYVAMIGDGLNDAGALSQSNVGIVITETTSNFTPACDIIVDAKAFEKLPFIFSFSKLSIHIVYLAYSIALVYNIVGLSYAVQGALSPVIAAILMPLSSITIVLFGVGASTLLAYKNNLL